MRSATALSLFAVSSLIWSSLSAISDESTVYVIYREEGGGGCRRSPGKNDDGTTPPIVGVRGFVLDEEYSLVGGSSDDETGSCAEEMACFVAPQSEACLNLNRTFEAYGEIVAQHVPPTTSTSLIIPGGDDDATNYYNCVRKSPSLSQCYQIRCGSSSLYPHCSFDIISTSDLADNLKSLEENSADSESNGIVYAAHYSDKACSTANFAGLRGFLAYGQTGTQVPVLGDGSDCNQSMACLLQPDSFACEVLSPLGVAEVTISVVEDANGEAAYQMCTLSDNEQQCQITLAGECIQSPVFPSCYVRLMI